MKNLLFFLTFVIIWPIEIYCQNINNISDEYGVIYIPVNDSTLIYCTKKGKQHKVKLNQISFVNGSNALVEFLKKNIISLIRLMMITLIESFSSFFSIRG